jgi:hypothetical protein
MVHIGKKGIVLILIVLSILGNAQRPSSKRKDIILIKGIRTAYLPFSSFSKPVFEMTNDQLNIAVTDAKGNMFQVNGIDAKRLKKGVFPASAFQTVLIMAKGGTYTDDADTNPNSLIEIICENNTTNSPITIGLKTTVQINGKNHRVYATLSGIIPSNQYQRTN